MSKIEKIIMVYDDKVKVMSGSEAEKYIENVKFLMKLGTTNHVDPFTDDPVDIKTLNLK